METSTKKSKVLVIGGGFAGLNVAQQLFGNKSYDVTLIDKNNYNYFTPLLYQVATSFLEPSSISYPFRKLLRGKGINFRMAELEGVDTITQTVYLNNGEMKYDHLVFATGTRSNYFGKESIRKNAISLKEIDDALFMRNALLKTIEKAVLENDPVERKKLLTIVVAGGGPTGVEVAGMLAEMRKYIFEKDYPELKGSEGEIYIVDGLPVLLAPMSDKSHKDAYEVLDKLGVKIKLNAFVDSFEDGQVKFVNGDIIESRTLIWAAGVTGITFDGIPETSLGPGKRMVTDEFNRVKGLENVWAIGDISIQQTDTAYPKGHPQLAQPAIQQGKRLGKNLLRLAEGKPMVPFKYFDRGDMAIIGRNYAVADLLKHKLHLNGFFGLMSWLFIHIMYLINYTNRIRTLYNWTVAYLTRDQSLRMIFRTGRSGEAKERTRTSVMSRE